MNRRTMLMLLALCACLAGVAAWLLFFPGSVRTLNPTGAADPNADWHADGDPLDYNGPDDELSPDSQPTEGNAPKGGPYVRLVDSISGNPVVNVRCALFKAAGAGKLWQFSKLKPVRRTDASGRVCVTVGSIGVHETGEVIDAGWEVAFGETGSLQRFLLPLPAGWQPACGSVEIAESVAGLYQAPRTASIDIPIKPAANLRIVARDEWGQPLQDAALTFCPVLYDCPAEEWLFLADDLPEGVPEGEWPTLVTADRRYRLRQAVEAVFNGKRCGGGPVTDGTVKPPSAATHEGSVMLRGLPSVRIGAMAWLPGYGFGEAALDLKPGANELNVFLKPPPMGVLEVNVDWHGKELKRTIPEITLVSAAPWGLIPANPDTYSFKWLLPIGDGRWRGEIHNVPAGFWRLRVSFATGDAGSEYFDLQPGTNRKITLYAGDAAGATWAPVFCQGGKELASVSVQMLGHEDVQPTEYTIEYDTEKTKSKGLKLNAGTYTVWIPTLKPVTISLSPGQRLEAAYDLTLATAKFSIEQPLADLLSPDGGAVRLWLVALDCGKTARVHVLAFDAAMREQDTDYDQLRPGVTRTWTIPQGRYAWQLSGSSRQLEGEARFLSIDTTSVTFGFHTCPGLELLEIDLSEFPEGEYPKLKYTEAGLMRAALNASAGQSFTTDISEQLAREPGGVQVLKSPDPARLFAFAASGLMRVEAESSKRVGSETVPIFGWFRVTFPGTLTIKPGQLAEPFPGTIEFDTRDDLGPPFRYHVAAFHENGQFAQSGGGSISTPFGAVTLVVCRSFGDRFEIATVQTAIGGKSTLALPALGFEKMARVTLTFKGHGSPELPVDAWWHGQAGPHPFLIALDQTIGGLPRYVSLGAPDHLLPDGRLEFSYENRVLPAGRYKLIPWPGAPEKYCTTFTLSSGDTQALEFQGG